MLLSFESAIKKYKKEITVCNMKIYFCMELFVPCAVTKLSILMHLFNSTTILKASL